MIVSQPIYKWYTVSEISGIVQNAISGIKTKEEFVGRTVNVDGYEVSGGSVESGMIEISVLKDGIVIGKAWWN